MSGTDQIYTPESVATALVQAALGAPLTIADFAAGEGALLRASAMRWPDARHLAVDIDRAMVAALNAAHPDWEVHEADFLEPPPPLSRHRGGVDLVLLNPPFSCRGNARHQSLVSGEPVTCSRAMAFVCSALPFLSARGELIAIVPASCLISAKDEGVRQAIGRGHAVEVLQPMQSAVFEGRAVAVAQIRISRDQTRPNAWRLARLTAEVRRLHAHYKVWLARGSLSVHQVGEDQGGSPFIHTTDLRGGRYSSSGKRSERMAEIAQGECVLLLPRVGRPDARKLLLFEGPAVLSDCLFRLRTEPAGHEEELRQVLEDHWPALAAIYGGSCAPYATLAGLRLFLASLGLDARIELKAKSAAPAQALPLLAVVDEAPPRRRSL